MNESPRTSIYAVRACVSARIRTSIGLVDSAAGFFNSVAGGRSIDASAGSGRAGLCSLLEAGTVT